MEVINSAGISIITLINKNCSLFITFNYSSNFETTGETAFSIIIGIQIKNLKRFSAQLPITLIRRNMTMEILLLVIIFIRTIINIASWDAFISAEKYQFLKAEKSSKGSMGGLIGDLVFMYHTVSPQEGGFEAYVNTNT